MPDEPARRRCSRGRGRAESGRRARCPEKRVVDRAVEDGEPLGRVAGYPEPHCADRPRRGRDVLDRLSRRAVGGDRDARENAGEHRRRRRRARAAVTRARCPGGEAAARRARRRTGAISRADLRRRRYSAVFVRLPQMDIEHHVDEAFREASIEEPAAALLATAFIRLQAPDACASSDDERESQRARGSRPRRRREPQVTQLVQLDAEPTPGERRASNSSRSRCLGAPRRACSAARACGATSRSARAATNESASTTASSGREASATGAMPPSCSGVAMSSCAKSGISVLTKSWTRSSGGGAGARPPAEPFEIHGSTVRHVRSETDVLPVSTTPSKLSYGGVSAARRAPDGRPPPRRSRTRSARTPLS